MSKKSFHVLLAENDEEYTYCVRTCVDLDKRDILSGIEMAFLPHQIRAFEVQRTLPISKENKYFPSEENCPTYGINVTVGLKIDPEVILQEIILQTGLYRETVVVFEEGQEPHKQAQENKTGGEYKPITGSTLFDATPDEGMIDEKAQETVGTKRVENFMRELERERKERIKLKHPNKETAYCTTHLVAGALLGEGVRKGYYVVTEATNGLEVAGPFNKAPSNYKFTESVKVPGGPRTVSRKGNLFEMKYTNETLPAHAQASINDASSFEVEVENLDTGGLTNVVVKARDQDEARTNAVNVVASRQKVDPESLVAKHPEN
jgi:hypothetical protein